MDKALALKLILGISIGGMLFSGYLSVNELIIAPASYGGLTNDTCVACAGGSALLGLPVCVYGLLMYAAVLVISLLGLMAKK